MKHGGLKWSHVLSGLCAMGLSGCATGSTEPEHATAPHVLSLSTYAASIGTPIDVVGANFPAGGEGGVQLIFDGEYATASGAVEPIHSEVDLRQLDRTSGRWTTFGPFYNPLGGAAREPGTFTGTITAQVSRNDGTVVRDRAPSSFTFDVLPSIMVDDFQPVTATCAEPARRAFGGARYRMRVRAVGFQPTAFRYTISVPSIRDVAPIVVTHRATGVTDALDGADALALPPVPNHLLSYGAVISVEATADRGPVRTLAFAINVGRPMEVFYNGSIQLAEILPAVPVSACIPGGPNGRRAGYVEANSETRSRQLTVAFSEEWMHAVTRSSSTSVSNSWSTTDGSTFSTSATNTNGWSLGQNVAVNRGTTDTNDWHTTTTDGRTWNIGGATMIEGGVNLPLLASARLQQQINYGYANMHSTADATGGSRATSNGSTNGLSDDVNGSTATTDSTSRSHSTTIGGDTTMSTSTSDTTGMSGGMSQAQSWAVSSTDSIARDFGGTVVAGQFGVFYRQSVRFVRRGYVVLYNQCGIGSVVGQVDLDDWAWSPDLAQAPTCVPFPQTNLPAPACILSPCAGQ
jgi:hypothetical protein